MIHRRLHLLWVIIFSRLRVSCLEIILNIIPFIQQHDSKY